MIIFFVQTWLIILFLNSSNANFTITDKLTTKIFHSNVNSDAYDMSSVVNLGDLDICSPIGMGLIKGGLNFNIKPGYLMAPGYGCRISANNFNFFPIYVNNQGSVVTFTESGLAITVFFDQHGCPNIVDQFGQHLSGYREVNGQIMNGSPNEELVPGQLDYDTIALQTESLGSRYLGYHLLHRSNQNTGAPQSSVYGLGYDFKNFDFSSAIGLDRINSQVIQRMVIPSGYLLVPFYGVLLSSNSNEYYPVFYESATKNAVTFDETGSIHHVVFNTEGIPLTFDKSNGRRLLGYRKIQNRIIDASPNSIITHHHLNIFDIKKQINQLSTSFPGYWLLHSSQSYMHNGMKNPTVPKPKFGIGLNLGNLNLKMSGNHGMGLIRGGLRGNIPAGFVIVPGMGVKISTDSAFYPVTVDKFGDAFCFDDYGNQIEVKFGPSGIPAIVTQYGNVYEGYRELENQYYLSQRKMKHSRQKLDTSYIVSEIQKLGPSFPGYYCLFPISSYHQPIHRRNTGLDLNNYSHLKRSRNLGGNDIIVPEGYLMIPKMGIRIIENGQFYNVYTSFNGELVTFDDDLNLLKLHQDSNNVPVYVSETGTIFGGYLQLDDGRTIEANLGSTIGNKILDVNYIKQQIEYLGSEYIYYYFLHGQKSNSANSLYNEEMHAAGSFGPTIYDFNIFKSIESNAKINMANYYKQNNIHTIGLIDASTLNVPIPLQYILIPKMGTRVSPNFKYYPIFLASDNTACTFNEDGDEIEVYFDNDIPYVVYNSVIYHGYIEIGVGKYKYSHYRGVNYQTKTFDRNNVIQEIERKGKKDNLAWYTIHNQMINITITKTIVKSKQQISVIKPAPLQPLVDINVILKVNYVFLNAISAMSNITGGLPIRETEKRPVIPGLGVSLSNNDIWYPCYLDNSKAITYDDNGIVVEILFDRNTAAPVSLISGIKYRGFILINSKPVYSDAVKGNFVDMTIDVELIYNQINVLGPSFLGFYSSPRNNRLILDSTTLETILSGIGLHEATHLIHPSTYSFNVPDNFIMLIGFGVLLSRNDVYHPIYVEKESQKVCAFDKTGVIYDVYFDGQGAPIIMSDGPLVGFVMKNNAPVYAANGGTFQKFKLDVEIIIKYINKLEEHPAYFTVNKFKKIDSFIYDIFETIDLKGALVNINKNIGVTVLKDYFVVPAISVTQSEDELNYPVYANKMGNLVTFDPEGNILKVHQDLRGIPCIVKDSVIYKGAIWHDGQIKYSLNLGRTFEIQLNVTKIRNTIFKLGANYPFYSAVYKPISIDSLMERMLANIGAKDITEAVGLVNIFPKNVASNFYTVPYFGIRLNNNDSFYPLYVNNKNMELFSFDESLKMYRVLFSEDLYPLVITESGVVYSGYIYTDGGPKYGTNFEKYNPARINVDLVISAVEKLSYSYFGYTTVHAPIEISYILTSLFSSMTVECAYGLISKNTTFKIVKENYVAVVGLSVPINDVWSPIYANKEGLLYAFNSDGTEIEVFIDIFGVPVIVIKDVRYAGYIMLNGSPKYAITEGILRPASIDVSVLVTTINRIGPSAPLFYCTCNSIDMNVILPEILNSIDHLLAHGPINAGLLEKVPLNYYAVPSVGIRIVTNGIIKYYPCYCHEGKLVFIDDTSKVYECMQDIQGAPIVNIDGVWHIGFIEYIGRRVFSILGSKLRPIKIETNIVINSLTRIGPQYFGFLTLDLNRPLDLVADLEKIMGGLTLENSNNNIQYNDRPSVQDYIMVPGFGVQIVSNEKFVPVYCDRRFGNLKAFTEEGEVVRVVVDVQNIVVTISDSNIITQGFIVVDGKPRFSVTQGTTRQIVVDVNTIISTIERLGPDHPSYLTLHPPIDFKDLEKNFLNTITLENSIGLINSGLDISIPIGHAMVPGMGVALDNSKNYYPVFINTARKCVVYSNEGIMYNVLFGNGVPVCRSNEDPEVFYPGFIVYKNETRHSPSKSTYKEIQLDYNIIFNKVEQLSYEFVGYKFQHPKIEIDNLGKILEALNLRSARGLVNTEYTNVGLEYLLVPGMAVQYKTNWHALYVNKNGEVFTFIDDKPIDVVFDLQNLPRIEMDGSIYTGYVEYFNEIRHSVSVGSSVKLTFNITIIQNTLQRLGPEFENGFLSLPAHRPIDIQTDIGEILDSLDISNAIGLITAGLNFEVPEDFLMIPGMGTKVNLNSEYFPIYINSKSFDIVAFDRDGTVLKVKWDIQNAPCIVLNEGLIIPGYIYIKGQIRHSVIRGKVKAMTLDIEVIKRTIIRLGVNYSAGYKTLFRPPNINMILAKVYSSLTIDIALGALNSLTGIQVPKKYVPLAAFGVMIQNLTKTPRYVPVYVDIDGGNLLTFDEHLTIIKVKIQDNGCPVSVFDNGQMFNGFITGSDGEIITNTEIGRVSEVFVKVELVISSIKNLGPAYFGYNQISQGLSSGFAYHTYCHKAQQIPFGGLIDVPKGFVSVDNIFCRVCQDYIFYPCIKNSKGERYAINTIGELFLLSFSPNGAPVYVAKDEKFYGYILDDNGNKVFPEKDCKCIS